MTDWEAFQSFVKAHPDKRQDGLAELWPGEVSARTIARALKRVAMKRPKRPMAAVSAMSQSELTSGNN